MTNYNGMTAGRGELRKAARLLLVLAAYALEMLGDEPRDLIGDEPADMEQAPLFEDAREPEQEQPAQATTVRASDRARYESCKEWAFNKLCSGGRFTAHTVAFFASQGKSERAREVLETMCGGDDGGTKRYIVSARAGYVARAIATIYPSAAGHLRIKRVPENKTDWYAVVPWEEWEIDTIRDALESC